MKLKWWPTLFVQLGYLHRQIPFALPLLPLFSDFFGGVGGEGFFPLYSFSGTTWFLATSWRSRRHFFTSAPSSSSIIHFPWLHDRGRWKWKKCLRSFSRIASLSRCFRRGCISTHTYGGIWSLIGVVPLSGLFCLDSSEFTAVATSREGLEGPLL